MSERLRRANIVELLKQIILENNDLTVAQLLISILRRKNFDGGDPYEASDIKLSSVLENTLEELKITADGEQE